MRLVAAALSGIAVGTGSFWLLAWAETASRLNGLGLSLTFGGELVAGTDWPSYVVWEWVIVLTAAVSVCVAVYWATKTTRPVRAMFFLAAASAVMTFDLIGTFQTMGTVETLRSTGALSVAAVSNAGATSMATYVALGLFLGASVTAALKRISPTSDDEGPVQQKQEKGSR